MLRSIVAAEESCSSSDLTDEEIAMSTRMKLLIAYDGSECAGSALTDLERAGLPREAEALVISVAEAWLPLPPPSSYEIVETAFAKTAAAAAKAAHARESYIISEARELALKASKRIKVLFPAWEVRAEAYFGSPSSQLLTKADEWRPDLIVVGSHGRSLVGRLILGSISHRVIIEAHCSVRVARGHDVESDSPVRIIIGVDGSEGAEAAVRAVAARDWPAGSEAMLVAVYDPVVPTAVGQFIPTVVEWVDEDNESEQARAQRILDSSEQLLCAAKLKVATEVRVGDPRHILVKEAERWKADCIFVGARGLSRLDRFLLGSVSTAVSSRAHCSVEVVRTTDKA